MPILTAAQIKRMSTLCGADLPPAFVNELNRRSGDDEGVLQFGIDYATRQCEELLREGAPGLHFYTLNKARSTSEIAANLNLANQSV
jgi:methylenetetrahydrofolate reductase (NADPH)